MAGPPSTCGDASRVIRLHFDFLCKIRCPHVLPRGEDRPHPFRCERNLSESRTGRVEDSVRNGGGDNGYRGLACAHGAPFSVDQLRANHGNLSAQKERPIGSPVDGRDLFVIPGHFLEKCTADALNSATFELVIQSIGIGDRPAIIGDVEILHDNRPGALIDFHFSNGGAVPVVSFIKNAGNSPSGDCTRSPIACAW